MSHFSTGSQTWPERENPRAARAGRDSERRRRPKTDATLRANVAEMSHLSGAAITTSDQSGRWPADPQGWGFGSLATRFQIKAPLACVHFDGPAARDVAAVEEPDGRGPLAGTDAPGDERGIDDREFRVVHGSRDHAWKLSGSSRIQYSSGSRTVITLR
jgi:hypothetical protein